MRASTAAVGRAYGVALALILGLVALSLWQGARVKRALDAQEKRMGRNG